MRFRLVTNGEAHEVEAGPDGVSVDGRPVKGSASRRGPGVDVRIGRRRHRVIVTRWGAMVGGRPLRFEVRDFEPGDAEGPAAGPGHTGHGPVEVRPPMPGRIVKIAVAPGDRVARHAPLIVLEAMKMQNEIPAPVAGVVREVRVKEGQGVLASDILVVVEPR